MDGLFAGPGPEVQLVAGSFALEAVEELTAEIR